VAVSNSAGTMEVIDRRRVAVTTPGTPGANQPYHFAENLEVPEAEKFLGNCFAASKRLALTAVRDVVGELRGRQYLVVGSAVLWSFSRTALDQGSENGGTCCHDSSGKQAKMIPANRRTEKGSTSEKKLRPCSSLGKP
jgi:hypothetical protein